MNSWNSLKHFEILIKSTVILKALNNAREFSKESVHIHWEKKERR